MRSARIIFEERVQHRKYRVLEEPHRNGTARYLTVNGAIESAMLLGGRGDELLFPYMRDFAFAVLLHPEEKKTLLIGAGGFAYPRHFLHRYPDKQMDAAESDPEMIRLSRRFFRLNELEKEAGPRFRLLERDGFAYLRETTERYGLIICDAYDGSRPAGLNRADAETVRDHLTDNGVYCLNIVTAGQGRKSRRGREVQEMLSAVFSYTMMLACEPDRSPRELQNFLLFASMKELSYMGNAKGESDDETEHRT